MRTLLYATDWDYVRHCAHEADDSLAMSKHSTSTLVVVISCVSLTCELRILRCSTCEGPPKDNNEIDAKWPTGRCVVAERSRGTKETRKQRACNPFCCLAIQDLCVLRLEWNVSQTSASSQYLCSVVVRTHGPVQ